MKARIAIVGEYDETVPAHERSIPSLKYSADFIRVEVEAEWVPTISIDPNDLESFDGIWMSAGPAYRDLPMSLQVLRTAREKKIPCLATCRGYQHMVLEFAKNVVGLMDAAHEEYEPHAPVHAITRLPTGHTARKRRIDIVKGSPLRAVYYSDSAVEKFFGKFGVKRELESELSRGGFVSMASDYFGNYRVAGISLHPFYIGSLFLPQMRATQDSPHPLLTTFLKIATVLRQFGIPKS